MNPSYVMYKDSEKTGSENECSGTFNPAIGESPSRQRQVTPLCNNDQESATPRQYSSRPSSPHLCRSPAALKAPESNSSDEPMNNECRSTSPPESPGKQETTITPVNIGRLSLGDEQNKHQTSVPHRGRGQLGVAQTSASKRSASSKAAWLPGGRSPIRRENRSSHPAGSRIPPTGASRRQRKRQHRDLDPQLSNIRPEERIARPPPRSSKFHNYGNLKLGLTPRDSGYDSMPSRTNTLEFEQQKHVATVTNGRAAADDRLTSLPEDPADQLQKDRTKLSADARWPGLILQPDSSPISQEQLAAEVKGIYAGLVMVEAKCIKIDAAQATDTTSSLGQEQWQALIALHRTLLYEHHDFLMATQHPSATPALRNLATKYSMPARMWKHGIHAFLEVLRHRRPESQEHMLAFIYLAYSMMALLYETVPIFLDTWIECLGDLARYRMAIEEEREPHAQWGGVAASWYFKAADRHPQIGRLYHHLGILERPSLHKLRFYSKSVTCVIPFPNARDSMKTFCDPIVQDDQILGANIQSAEANYCKVFALIFLGQEEVVGTMIRTSSFISQSSTFRWKDCGVSLAITNISALFDFGTSSSVLRYAYDLTIFRTGLSSNPPSFPGPNASDLTSSQFRNGAASLFRTVKDLTMLIFHAALECHQDNKSIQGVLPYLHVMLGFLHGISFVCKTTNNDHDISDTASALLRLGDSWGKLATFLNDLVRLEPITARVQQCARTGVWLWPDEDDRDSRKALPEDYAIRGLVWASWMFVPGWFDDGEDENGRAIETDSTLKRRRERTLYWALRLAYDTQFLEYDPESRTFSAPGAEVSETRQEWMGTISTSALPGSGASSVRAVPSPTPPSSHSDGDFVHVRRPNTTNKLTRGPPQKPHGRSWAASTFGKQKAGKPKNSRIDDANVQVVDEDVMEWEMGE